MSTPAVEVVAVEDTAVQLAWRRLPDGTVRLRAGDVTVTVEGGRAPGPGIAWLEGLRPATPVDVAVRVGRGPERTFARVATLAPPPGAQLCRVATLSDIHVGSDHFGKLPVIRDPHGDHAARCVRAALDDIAAWGADLLVVKGDLTEQGALEEWDEAGAILASCGLPVLAVPGNHDTVRGAVDGTAALAAHGVPITYDVASHDLPGLRVVVANTTVPGRGVGSIAERRAHVLDALAGAPGGALLGLHHYPQRLPVPTMWPPGIPAPSSSRFLDDVAAANPATLVTSGHSHRHRRHAHGPLTVTEVGAPKDHLGTWTGYAVHEAGIRQVSRLVGGPQERAWIERTRRTFFGLWPWWAPGHLEDRCFSVTWPPRGRPAQPTGATGARRRRG